MKEDILEQLVDDYLQSQGYFTRHNIKFRPRSCHPDFNSKKHSNHSDIDVIGIHPLKVGPEKIQVVSCKSWTVGFRVEAKLEELAKNKIVSGREAWMGFRELMKPIWTEAFLAKIEELTGSREFTYVTAVTACVGNRNAWQSYVPFIEALQGNPIRIISLSEMITQIQAQTTTTVASSAIGRVLQLMKAAEQSKETLIKTAEEQMGDDQN